MSNQVEAWQKTLNTRGANPVLDVDGDFADKSLNASNALVKKLDTEIASLKKQVTDLTSSKKLLSDNLVNTNEALSDCKELIDIKERANASYVERNAILNNSVERLEAEKTADKEYINQLYSENLSLNSELEKPIEVIPPVVIKVADATLGELLGAIWSKIKGL
jgi:chromosome segregation ATPase